MRAVIQGVLTAKVTVDNETVSDIGKGLLVLLGIEEGDTEEVIDFSATKVSNLRIFEDSQGKMNLSVKDIKGEVLVVSQFTVCAYIKKGNRPSFSAAMEEEKAEKMYRRFVETLKEEEVPVKEGIFRARMKVHLVNDGPVTIILERKTKENQFR